MLIIEEKRICQSFLLKLKKGISLSINGVEIKWSSVTFSWEINQWHEWTKYFFGFCHVFRMVTEITETNALHYRTFFFFVHILDFLPFLLDHLWAWVLTFWIHKVIIRHAWTYIQFSIRENKNPFCTHTHIL